MPVYAIGDVQGCDQALQALLEKIGFDRTRDQLWFTGDLVNRGPQSRAVLRRVRQLGQRAVVVLGNHDLHLLALAAGQAKRRKHDTLDDILAAPDATELLDWLRRRPLLHHDAVLGYTLVHAGLLPSWTLAQAQDLAREAETMLQGAEAATLFRHMYGDLPDHWREDLRGFDRIRVIINAFTRLRYCDREGSMDLHAKGAPGSQPPDLLPWFQVPRRRNRDLRILFGHWSTLGVYQGEGVIGLDSGCVWGGALTAVRLDSALPKFFHVPCAPSTVPGHGP
jgi:bis(5'-nucleosyl)-tetraphosphatase (symmetrical)